MAKSLSLVSVPAYAADWLIVINVANPKRPGTACFDRFELFSEADTVADFAKLCGKGYRSEIAWCAARGYISLLDPAEAPADEVEAVEVEAVEVEAAE